MATLRAIHEKPVQCPSLCQCDKAVHLRFDDDRRNRPKEVIHLAERIAFRNITFVLMRGGEKDNRDIMELLPRSDEPCGRIAIQGIHPDVQANGPYSFL